MSKTLVIQFIRDFEDEWGDSLHAIMDNRPLEWILGYFMRHLDMKDKEIEKIDKRLKEAEEQLKFSTLV